MYQHLISSLVHGLAARFVPQLRELQLINGAGIPYTCGLDSLDMWEPITHDHVLLTLLADMLG